MSEIFYNEPIISGYSGFREYNDFHGDNTWLDVYHGTCRRMLIILLIGLSLSMVLFGIIISRDRGSANGAGVMFAEMLQWGIGRIYLN